MDNDNNNHQNNNIDNNTSNNNDDDKNNTGNLDHSRLTFFFLKCRPKFVLSK